MIYYKYHQIIFYINKSLGKKNELRIVPEHCRTGQILQS